MLSRLPRDFSLIRYGLFVRFVNESDADFIVRLRTDEKLGKYIHSTDTNIDMQKAWIRAYKERESLGNDYYFIFEEPKGVRLGVCRIYDIIEGSFTIGSWVFARTAPIGASVLADIITREIAFELFPNSILKFDVRKANVNVNKYQSVYKPVLFHADENTNYYYCPKENFEQYKCIFLRMFNQKK